MIQIFEYENSPIQFEVIDGHVMANATSMFRATHTRLDKWKDSNSTKKYIEAVTLKWGIAENQLVVTKRGGLDQQGTWIHEKLILNAARYISVDFELWCDEKIAELVKTGSVSLKPKSAAELLLDNALVSVEHERRLNSLESEVQELKAKATTRPDYYTVAGYAALNRIPVGVQLAASIGRKASEICKKSGIATEEIPDPRFGRVKTYPISILQQVFTISLS